MSRAHAYALYAAVAALAVALYLPALPGPLLLDDSAALGPVLRYAREGGDWVGLIFGTAGPLGRPLAQLSFLANAVGSPDLRWWKATNLALHLFNGVLIQALTVALFSLGGVAPTRGRTAALLVAGIWLVHPLQISTVMYTVQRMTELSASFCLLGMLLYVRGRTSADPRGRTAIVCAFVLCTPLAVLAKETGALLPFMLAAIEWLLVARGNGRPAWLLALFGICALLPALAAVAYLASDIDQHLLGGYAIRNFTLTGRALTEPAILLAYLGMIVMPQRRAMGFFHDDFAIAHGLFDDPLTAFALVAVFALIGAIFLLRRRYPLVAFGLALFFIGHALESTIFALELMFEHRNYLPSLGIILALAAGLERHLRGYPAGVLGLLVLASFAAVTAGQARLWGDQGRLYASFVEAHPDSERARVTLAEWYTANRAYEAALASLDGAAGLTPALHRLRIGCAMGAPAPADIQTTLATVAAAPRLDLLALETLKLLAREVGEGRCRLPAAELSTAIDGVLRGAMRRVARYLLLVEAARLRYASGERAAALAQLTQAAALAPDDPFPFYLATEWAADSGDDEAARRYLRLARERARHSRADFSMVDAAVTALIAR